MRHHGAEALQVAHLPSWAKEARELSRQRLQHCGGKAAVMRWRHQRLPGHPASAWVHSPKDVAGFSVVPWCGPWAPKTLQSAPPGRFGLPVSCWLVRRGSFA